MPETAQRIEPARLEGGQVTAWAAAEVENAGAVGLDGAKQGVDVLGDVVPACALPEARGIRVVVPDGARRDLSELGLGEGSP